MLPGPISLKNMPLGPMHQMMGMGDQLHNQVVSQLGQQAKDRLAQMQLKAKDLTKIHTNTISGAIASLLWGPK